VNENSRSSGGVTRRSFLAEAATRTAAASVALGAIEQSARAAPSHASSSHDAAGSVRDYLNRRTLRKEWVDRFLDPKARVWARFDPELGYLLRNALMRDGMVGSYTLARYEPTGQRKQVNFADQSCRINTYGDSFTQGHQVSDGETWQEVLSAHFCEPIRNFGVGGFGVYQAYRRLLRMEATPLAAPYLVFNIWGDDHLRSIMSWRWLTFSPDWAEKMATNMFHANPWVHARLDPSTGRLVEKENPCPTPDSLYRLCDKEFVYQTFKDDEVVRILVAQEKDAAVDPRPLERMATAIQMKDLDFRTPEATRNTARKLYHAYAIRVGMRIMEKLQTYVEEKGKKLMVLLSYPSGSVWHACAKPARDPNFVDWHPQEFRDFLASRKIPFVDTLPKHVAEFQMFRCSAKEYVDRYYIGHYNPRGNHFFAYAVKNELVNWLDPKPPAYQGGGEALIRFKGYLPG
jgi:hypothetical protein